MEVLGIILAIIFCIVMSLVIYVCVVMSDRTSEYEEYERINSDMNENDIYKEQLKRIKRHIDKKLLRNWEVDMGMSSNRSDRLMTETVVELQVIESMIDEVVDCDDEE